MKKSNTKNIGNQWWSVLETKVDLRMASVMLQNSNDKVEENSYFAQFYRVERLFCK